ncbi:hypothetical protein RYX36_001098, partial [Vicia faba]
GTEVEKPRAILHSHISARRLLEFVMEKLSKDKGKQSLGNDIADEQSWMANILREIGGVLAMASKTDSVTSLPPTFNSSIERGSSFKTTLLL